MIDVSYSESAYYTISTDNDEDTNRAENYINAGKIVSKVRENARNKNHIGRTLFEICESIENEIISLGGRPAFPVNVSLNEIALIILLNRTIRQKLQILMFLKLI